jgi:hypothetical protein
VRPVERLKGTGVVTTRRGKEISVQYHITFAPDDPAATGDTPASALKAFSGQVWCPYDGSFVCVHSGQTMTLRMEDGRQLCFSHSNRDGGVTVTKWIG